MDRIRVLLADDHEAMLDRVPKGVQPRAKQHLQDIWMAETKEVARKAFASQDSRNRSRAGPICNR